MTASDVSLTIAMERHTFDDLGERMFRAYLMQRGARTLFKVIRAGLSEGTLEEIEAADLCELGEFALAQIESESEAIIDLATDLKNVSGKDDPILHHRRRT